MLQEDSEEEARTRMRIRDKSAALRGTSPGSASSLNTGVLGLLNLCQPAGKRSVAGLG